MNGIELIRHERTEQIEKHHRSIEQDWKFNDREQLKIAAVKLLKNTVLQESCPKGWDSMIWDRMVNKSYRERLVLAGAMLAAEIDRLNYVADRVEEVQSE